MEMIWILIITGSTLVSQQLVGSVVQHIPTTPPFGSSTTTFAKRKPFVRPGKNCDLDDVLRCYLPLSEALGSSEPSFPLYMKGRLEIVGAKLIDQSRRYEDDKQMSHIEMCENLEGLLTILPEIRTCADEAKSRCNEGSLLYITADSINTTIISQYLDNYCLPECQHVEERVVNMTVCSDRILDKLNRRSSALHEDCSKIQDVFECWANEAEFCPGLRDGAQSSFNTLTDQIYSNQEHLYDHCSFTLSLWEPTTTDVTTVTSMTTTDDGVVIRIPIVGDAAEHGVVVSRGYKVDGRLLNLLCVVVLAMLST